MIYGYTFVLSDEEQNDVSIKSGLVKTSDPRRAVTMVLQAETDWLDDDLPGLEPTIEITRNTEFEVFEAGVESHGLGNAGIILEKVEA